MGGGRHGERVMEGANLDARAFQPARQPETLPGVRRRRGFVAAARRRHAGRRIPLYDPRSVRVRMEEDAADGQKDDLDVEGERPVLDVIDVVDGSVANRCASSEIVDLCPAGYPRPHLVTLEIPGNLGAEALHEEGPFRSRPDQAHVPADDIDELRQLVETEPPHESPDRGTAGGVARTATRTGLRHRT